MEHGILVVGVDGSAASERALRWALSEGGYRGVSVHVIMAWESHAVMAGPGPLVMYPELAPHHVREQHRQELNRLVRDCLGGEVTPEVHVELAEGDPADVLTEKSAHATLLVLGDRGRGRVADAVLGSTALRCIHKARCPVLVVPKGMRAETGTTERDEGADNDPALG